MQALPERMDTPVSIEWRYSIEMVDGIQDTLRVNHELRGQGSQEPILSRAADIESLDGFDFDFSFEQPRPPPPQPVPNTNTWDEDRDPENPYNWPMWRINVNAGLLALLAFLSPFSSAIMAPATPAIMAEFNTENELLSAFVVSSYVLAVCLLPFLHIRSISECFYH